MENEEDDSMEQEVENVQDIENDVSNDSGLPNLQPTKQRSGAWIHYNEIMVNGVKYAKCNHCDT